MEFRLLGPLEVVDGGTTVRVGGLRQRTLLGVLLLHRGRVVPLERLVDAVWDTDPPSSARDQVRNSVWALRKALGDAPGRVVVTEDAGYRLDTDGHVVDADRFEAGVRAARSGAERGNLEQASAVLRTALDLWRGPVLAGLRAGLVRDLATGLDERRLLALEERLELDLALGRHGELVGELTELVAEHPGRMRVVGQLMRALHGAGRSADALTAYQRAKRHLADELGLDPPAELRELEAAILRDDPEPVPPRPGLRAADVPPRGRAVPRTLPYDVPDFTGRPAELQRLLGLGAAARTVVISTVEGMAGVGKTALAVHAAHALADRFPDGQLFVDLNGFTPDRVPTSPEDALAVLLSTLGVPRDRIPSSVDERVAMWRTEVADRRLLLVLDNAADAKQVAPLIPGSPGCLVLVTSRRRLTNLDGSIPVELDVLPEEEAVALVVAILGAARVDDEPEAVAELVGLCGRLPLAIRIVSAHLQRRPRWTIRSLTERMAGEKRRLTALAAAADHGVTTAFALSYRALAPDHRRVFRLLGLHPGADIDSYAVAALAGLDVDVADAVLEQLADEYLLQQSSPGRYTFHDLLRAHARACAEDEEPAAARHEALTRLFDHFRHTAAEAVNLLDPHDRDRRPRTEDPGAAPLPFGHDVAAARRWLDRETPNLLSVAAQDDRPAHTCDLSLILWRHLEQQARHREAEALHTHAVASARAAADPLAEAGATRNLGRTQWYLGDLSRAAQLFERALALFDHVENPLLTVTVLNDLATTVFQLGRHDEAIEHCERALAICAGTDDPTGEMQVLMTLGNGESLRGDDEASSRYLHQALRLAHAVGNRNIEARARLNIGDMYAGTGFPDVAKTYLEHALELYREIGNREGEAVALANLGSVHTRLGDERRATAYLDQALTFFQQNGDRRWQSETLREIGTLHARAGRHEQADRYYGEALDLVRRIGNRSAEADILDRLRENALARSARATE
ncbi:BTAD domain-containing putative transcriptional regulator [Actinosynnema sp. NPDC002837]